MNGRADATGGIVLSVALRTSDRTGTPAKVSWADDSPATAVAVDIISACGGAADQAAVDPAHGSVLGARFSNLQSAMLATRRLVWALEGLAETTHSTTAATIAIHSVEEELTSTVASALDSLAQGEIVLSVGTAEMVRHLPGMIVRDAPGGNWRELQWRSEQGKNLAADEQSVLRLIRALGREDPLRGETSVPAAVPAVTATTGEFHASASLGRSLEEPETASPFWKKAWVMVGAGAVVLVLLAVLIIPVMLSGNHSKAPVPDGIKKEATPAAEVPKPEPAQVPNAGPGEVQSVPSKESSHVVPDKQTEPTTPKTKHPKQPSDAANGSQAPGPKTMPASCTLTEGEIPGTLARAEQLMYAGNLRDAQSAFQRLVGCPSAREKANEGLRQVKQRLAASPSEQ